LQRFPRGIKLCDRPLLLAFGVVRVEEFKDIGSGIGRRRNDGATSNYTRREAEHAIDRRRLTLCGRNSGDERGTIKLKTHTDSPV
jgi:hypothetical protein